ncbi:MAG: hypothetical protein GY938_13690, partial [Ketobacter sp.]|nr:hypothetical protein [Ketobacter sp.]
TTYHRIKARTAFPASVSQRTYHGIPRPKVIPNEYIRTQSWYHLETRPAFMTNDPQRFDIMSITRMVRKKHLYGIRATTAQRQELERFKKWKNRRSGKSQWNLPQGEEPNRFQNYLQEWHVPELGFVGVEKQAKSTAQGWRLVQIQREVTVQNFPAEWYALGAYNVSEEYDKNGKTIKNRYKTILKRAYYVWFPTEFDAFN